MRAKLAFLAATLLVLAIGGCSKPANTVVGTWTVEGQDATATFDPGGTFTIVGSKGGVDETIKGTYVLQDKSITMTNTDISLSTKTPELQKGLPMIKKRAEQMQHVGQAETSPIDFKDGKFAIFQPGAVALKGPHTFFSPKK